MTYEDDPELAALLDFEPVPRRIERGNGWSAENQRAFIAGLVETGNYRLATQRLGLTASGVYQLRKDAGAEDFSRAWDEAVALHRRRNPAAQPQRSGRGTRPLSSGSPERDEEKERAELFQALLRLYWTKIEAERKARLEGRIAAADFYVRQLTSIELAADLSANGGAFLAELKRGTVGIEHALATPLSLYFDYLRRSAWADAGEPERPELPRFGAIEDGVATAPREDRRAAGEADAEWRRRADLEAAGAAEAQRLWEAKARADAVEWRGRMEREDPDGLARALAEPEVDMAWRADRAGEDEGAR